ncbi:helix-turn-helix domain-containing protein [Clostridioides difficile]|nr:helix-turn-helix domain-containing protein [Clostridioides difficile]MDC9263027.1 helix-turn-helix domain-containing protein [Clostridioides difficile]
MLKFGNNMTKTAKELGISRNTLYLKIKKYGIKTS